ncbi:MAG: glycosyltransferase, partial [Thermoanaerobaculia bacterium]
NLAKRFGARAMLLDWELPNVQPRQPGTRIVFPASMLDRKGAREVHEAARRLNISIDSVTGAGWLDDVAAVVLPSFVEARPRRLLEAIAAGIPVIASHECGVDGLSGVTSIDAGDAGALAQALHARLRIRR